MNRLFDYFKRLHAVDSIIRLLNRLSRIFCEFSPCWQQKAIHSKILLDDRIFHWQYRRLRSHVFWSHGEFWWKQRTSISPTYDTLYNHHSSSTRINCNRIKSKSFAGHGSDPQIIRIASCSQPTLGKAKTYFIVVKTTEIVWVSRIAVWSLGRMLLLPYTVCSAEKLYIQIDI